MVLPLRNQGATSQVQNDHQYAGTKATTGFFFSQDLNTDATVYDPVDKQKLFRFEALNAGKSVQEKVKISISNIKAPTGDFQNYGTFSVLVRAMNDNDNVQVILERYDNLNLNPASSQYIANQIGDIYEQYDPTTKTNRQYGTYTNRSKYIRVVMDEDVDRGSVEAELLPFGVFGPLKYRDVSLISGSAGFQPLGTLTAGARAGVDTMADGDGAGIFGAFGGGATTDGNGIFGGLDDVTGFTGSIVFPSVPLRETYAWGSPKSKKDISGCQPESFSS